MKSLKHFLSLVICLTFLGTSVTTAQEITNNTDCDFIVKINYALASSPCDVVNHVVVPVPVNATVPSMIPAGHVIVEAKGSPGITFCNFYIGTSCSIYPSSLTLPCPCTPSGNYSVGLTSAVDILIQ